METKLRELRCALVELLKIPRRKPARLEMETMATAPYPPTVSQPVAPEIDAAYQEQVEKMRIELEKHAELLRDQLEITIAENTELKSRVKLLRDEIIDAKGAVRIVCRVKPSAERVGVRTQDDDRSVTVAGKRFSFDRVFGSMSTQQDVFRELAPVVEGVLDGYTLCVFAYGQTGSGKTYTMEGEHPHSPGLIYQSLNMLARDLKTASATGFQSRMKVKYFEIYNETIKDLLSGNQVQIVHEGDIVRLTNCEELSLNDLTECAGIIRQASLKRAVGETDCNRRSSRSHLVFCLSLTLTSPTERREGSLVLIDLAGSERLSESHAQNERLKETQNINKSLSALGNVFAALRRRDKHIPYRDSKLTHLMKNYLGGQSSRVAMIVNIDPGNESETVNSLRFATRVSECELGGIERNIRRQT